MRALTPIPDDSALHGGEPRQTTCGGCELLCEDLTVQSIKTGTGCTVADSWFASGASPSETTIDGKRASLHEAINIAAKRLLSSHQPLLTGLTSTTLDAIQTACR
ncbi:MAG: hypothetical protein HN703_13380, partial [Planctomycetaceae bacterium]|nr:hypothetical protein [Planctomycetaceae bacterium]